MSFLSGFNQFGAAILAVSFSFGSLAQAAVLDFDLSNVCDTNACIIGGFAFDTDSQTVIEENTTFAGMSYNDPSNAMVTQGTSSEPFTIKLFEDDSPGLYELHISPEAFDQFMPGLLVGQTQSYSVTGGKYMDSFLISPFIDSVVEVTRRADNQINVVPLPAGLPLILTGLAAFGFARSRKTRD